MARRTKSSLTLADLEAMIDQAQSKIAALEKERGKHQAEVDKVDAQIAKLQGERRPPGKAAPKPRKAAKRRGKPLHDMIVEVLQAARPKTMKPKEIVQGVLKAGYKTTSENFDTIVYNTLAKEPRVVKKGKGLYTAKAK